MNISLRSVTLRAAAVAIATTAALVSLAATLAPSIDLDPGQPFAVLLGQWAGVVLLGCAAWLWLITAVVLLEALRAPAGARLRPHRVGIPAGYRRFLLGLCGLALTAGVSAPALATPGPVHLGPPQPATAPAATATAPVVTRPVTAAPRALRAAPQLHPRAALEDRAGAAIVVHRGDSLWRLAAERLSEDATDATISHTWRRLYAANRVRIGADPDLIEPGQRLELPRVW